MSGSTLSPGEQGRFKREAAEYAVTYVKSGMIVGLGGLEAARCCARIRAKIAVQGAIGRIQHQMTIGALGQMTFDLRLDRRRQLAL